MVETVDVNEFLSRTMGGRPCQLQMHIYQGCEFECGCGETHTYFSHSTEVVREIPMLKLVLQDPECE